MSNIQRTFFLLLVMLLTACDKTKPSDLIWYEEALQDDGTIILVKKIEKSFSVSRRDPGAETYGYRLPKVEISDPKTGQPIIWNPSGLPPLLPYAYHVHDGVPFIFASFYLRTSYWDWGCPTPPYIVFRWEGSKWIRIPLAALPTKFKRHNLLPGAGNSLRTRNGPVSIKPEMTVSVESIGQYVREGSLQTQRRYATHLYAKEIQYEDVGLYDDCNVKNQSTPYDNAEFK